MHQRSERDQIHSVVESLHAEFAHHGTGKDQVRRIVAAEYSVFRRAAIRTYVPTLVHRAARQRLRTEHSPV